MNFTEKKIKSELKYHGSIVDIYHDQVQLPNGKIAGRDVVRHCEAVVVLPVLPDGQLVFVEQYRYPLAEVLLELPAGKMDVEGESAAECARRELQEETGYQAGELEYLGRMATTPGFCDEIIHVFKADKLSLSTACPDEDEFVSVRKLSLEQLRTAVKNGALYDAKTITALFYAGYHL